VHVIAASLGISAILVTSSMLFGVVKYIGAAYMIYLGIKKLITRNDLVNAYRQSNFTYRKVFYEGLIVNAPNLKTALFSSRFFRSL
jgi:threonine/homoserine/homoserine lactone efflux protein